MLHKHSNIYRKIEIEGTFSIFTLISICDDRFKDIGTIMVREFFIEIAAPSLRETIHVCFCDRRHIQMHS